MVSRSQLLRMGLGSGAIGHRLRARRLHRLHAGVYAVGHALLSQRGRWMAAVLACGDGAVLSHRSGAALWGIRSYVGTTIDVTVPSKGRPSGPIRRHSARLPADEIAVCDGIPVTAVSRTIFDLAAVSPVEEVESGLREAEYRRLYDCLSLRDLLDRYRGRPGSRAVRSVLERRAESPGRIESPLERRFLPFLDRFGLPRPSFNAWLEVGGTRYRVDCLWPDRRQIVELDGWEGHGTRAAFREDRARDRRLRANGYGITRVAWSQLDDEPGEIAADLRPLLGP